MERRLRNVLIGVLGAAAAALCVRDAVQAAESGDLSNPGWTGWESVCEGSKCVNYDANCNNAGGNNNPSWANANFATHTFVTCTGGFSSGSVQTRNGTAANPNAGDYVYWCPWPQAGVSTWYAVDPL